MANARVLLDVEVADHPPGRRFVLIGRPAPRDTGSTDAPLGLASRAARALVLGVLVTCLATPAALAQATTTATVVAKGGVRTTLFPVTMDEITGQRFVVTFTVTPSVTGTVRAVAAGEGRVAVFRVDEPTGGAVTLHAIAIAAPSLRSLPPPVRTVLPARLPKLATVEVLNATGAALVICPASIRTTGSVMVASRPPGAIGDVEIPPACQVPGAAVVFVPFVGVIGQGRPPSAPVALPNTGLGGMARVNRSAGIPIAVALAMGLLLLGAVSPRLRRSWAHGAALLPRQLEETADPPEQVIERERLVQEIDGAHATRFLSRMAIRRDDDDRDGNDRREGAP